MSKTKMNRAIKYQIYPSEEQRLLIEQTFGCVRKVYNMGLEMNMGLYDMGYKTMSTFDLKSYNIARENPYACIGDESALPKAKSFFL